MQGTITGRGLPIRPLVMYAPARLLLLILVATELYSATVTAHVASSSCIPHERDALLAFKRGITSDPGGLLARWQRGGEDCCKWKGVLCSNHTSHVLKLQLGGHSLVGQISHSLLSLEHLEHLDLSGNRLNGSSGGRIPQFLGSMNSLKHLDLSFIPFSGRLPSQLGNLSNLQYLDLSSENNLLRPKDLSWLTHLQFLQYLNLCGVNLSAVGDWALAVNMLPSLKVLELSECSLTNANQSLPHLNLTNLEVLDLSGNLLNHPIASCWFWNITHLNHLYLGNMDLYGPLPLALGGMKYLQDLQIYSHSWPFHAQAKCIFITSLRNLCSLETLIIRYSLCGDISEILESLPRCLPNRLQELDLALNNITGILPNHMWPLTTLERLDLYGNSISGVIPNWMGQLTSLDYLDLSKNNINGMLPDSMRTLMQLTYLALPYNNITGPLPSFLGHFTSLNYLDLSYNHLTGHLPSFLGHFTSLNYLDLSYNHLTGHVPREIGMLRNLEILNLISNNLDGTITEEHFAGLQRLQQLGLSYNSLKIEISSQWQPPFSLLSGDFASCRMGPLFPSWLKWMVDIDYLDIYNTGINDRLPDWFCSTFSKAAYLNISNNQIHGGLPANMEHMSVQQFLLGSNQLTGPIPLMPISLTTLDLSGNLFSGPLQ